MNTIKVNKDKIEEIELGQIVHSGSISYYEISIEFDESWNDLIKKLVVVDMNRETGREIAIIENKTYLDIELKGRYKIGLVGYKIEDDKKVYQISTDLKKITINEGAGEVEIEEHEIPSLTEWELYIKQIQSICDGVVIKKIELTKQEENIDTYTIYYTNDTTFEFQVTNGINGKDGDKGEDAKINGVNSIILKAGDNIEIEQDGKETIIKSTASGNVEDVKVNGESVLDENKVAQIDISGKADKSEIPTKTSELENDSNYAKTNSNNNFSVGQTINGPLTVNGDIVQKGKTYKTEVEEVTTKQNNITLREDAVGGMTAEEFAGLIALLYNGISSGRLGFKADGTAYVGDVGDEQPLLTRDLVENLQEGQVLVWDGTNLKAVGSSEYAKTSQVPVNVSQLNNDNNYVKDSELINKVRSVLPTSANVVPSTLVANTEYYLEETANLSFAFPTAGEKGQYCFVKFTSGSTATVLAVSGENYVGDIPIPDANKTYEILATWNGTKWVCTYRTY